MTPITKLWEEAGSARTQNEEQRTQNKETAGNRGGGVTYSIGNHGHERGTGDEPFTGGGGM